MRNGTRMVGLLAVVGMWLLAVGAAWAAGASPDAVAREILDGAGIKGGLVVHLGCGDGKLTAALHASDSYLVHGLDSGRKNIARAREHIQALGLYGPVAVEQWRGRRLPYTDNLATLVVSERGGHASMAELLRVLAPNGVAYIKQGGKWTRTVKPRSPDIDEWTHYLHDATNNAVAHDTVVGPPRHLQWVGSPRWARHHDRMASLSALVSAGDRIFYIFDEGSHASVQLPSKWRLIARDAFNGTILWKREIDRWHPNLWPFKSGPAQPQRRLVAVGDALYVTLSLDAPLSALDGATGETVRTYEDTDATEEVIASEGVLFLLVTDSPMVYDDFRPERVGIGAERDRVARDWPWNGKPRRVMALDAATGKLLWEVEKTVVPLTLAADGRHVYFHDGERVVCLDRASGREKWQSEPVERRGVIPASFGPTLVVYEDVVLFAGGTRSMTALASETGKTLWSAEHARSGHYSPEDLLVLDGVVWSGATAGGGDSGEFVGLDLHTGEVRSRFETDSDIYFMHHRCHRGKATVRYLIPSRTGTEFVDPKTQHWDMNHWVRGGCIYGVMPCNGLLYATPHSCACYMESKLYGFNALAPASASRHLPANIPARNRLERGPAYGRPVEAAPADGDWPTYRGNTERSGFTKATVPADLTSAWETELGGRLSSVVVAEGKLLVSAVDRHMVHALDADSGEELWSYTAGGRVDSPPTVWQGRALFGSADGWVYCLRASDGELMWRFRAAPADRRLVAFEQIESVWPVPGSVMVLDPAANSGQAVAYCVAGRSMFLDGGLRLLMLDPRTGRKLSERILDERDPGTGENLQSHVVRQNMPVALPDVLASDGRHIYMRSQQFDLEGVRRHIAATDISPAAPTGGTHLFSPTGFVDGSWWHRSYWVYGKGFEEGAGGWPKAGKVMPGGHLLVVDDALVYGYGRKQEYYKWTTPVGYQLFAMNKLPKLLPRPRTETAQQAARRRRLPRVDLGYQWANDVPLQVRGIALAGGTLFIAGPPVVWDEDETFDRPDEPAVKAKLAQQNAALAGKSGALLWAVAASDGAKLAEHRLESPPAWDGMAAANGRLYISTTDGNVLCLAG